MKEMSENGPYHTKEHPARKLGDGTAYGFYTVGPGLPESASRGCMSWNDADAETHDMNMAWHSRDSEMTSKDARIQELEAERDKYKKSSLCSRQRIASMLHVWELRDKEAYRSNAGDELRAVVSLLDEALGGE